MWSAGIKKYAITIENHVKFNKAESTALRERGQDRNEITNYTSGKTSVSKDLNNEIFYIVMVI